MPRQVFDVQAYSSRAACSMKLGEFSEAMKDAEKCIELEPKSSTGYRRKGDLLFHMEEYNLATETYLQGLHYDPSDLQLSDSLIKMRQFPNPVLIQRRALYLLQRTWNKEKSSMNNVINARERLKSRGQSGSWLKAEAEVQEEGMSHNPSSVNQKQQVGGERQAKKELVEALNITHKSIARSFIIDVERSTVIYERCGIARSFVIAVELVVSMFVEVNRKTKAIA
ncbi:hypothetical protein CRG98_041176 [Punica granatum]|uniref:Uncharacterized protein n=1 Tax=Punica granatum TaxID=22663 RepID=A0A2I0I3G7_PUNGR|nr:hypothetical protein CRG98_041176 [Punica granatum]